jgi:UDP-2-acetamido-3-amino-2,3-dideoxy-glucuronate N-acetyltransferase
VTQDLSPSASLDSKQLGKRTRVWRFVVALSGASIGADRNAFSHCLIENDVISRDRVTLEAGVLLCDGMRVVEDVFIGANATNDKLRRCRTHRDVLPVTRIEIRAPIGAFAATLRGLTIGVGGMVGAFSVVTCYVQPNVIFSSNPAQLSSYAIDSE